MFIGIIIALGFTTNETNIFIILLGFIIFFCVSSGLFYIGAMFINQSYCNNCNKRVYAVFRDHRCQIEDKLVIDFEKALSKKINDIQNTALTSYLKNGKEKRIFIRNIASLAMFEKDNDYKYIMVAMGSLIEFLLIRYCDKNRLNPLDNNWNNVRRDKARFYNFVQSAIHNNIFEMKKRWEAVQRDLRDFRNYVHIHLEVENDEIDKEWYETMKPVFHALYEKFKENPI